MPAFMLAMLILFVLGASFLGGVFVLLASKIARIPNITLAKSWLAYFVSYLAAGLVSLPVSMVLRDAFGPSVVGLLVMVVLSYPVHVVVISLILASVYRRAILAYAAAVALNCLVISLLLFPVLSAGRLARQRADSANNLKHIVLAALFYEEHHGTVPLAVCDTDGKPLLSWRVLLLPYLEEGALYEKFRLDEPWDSPHNKKLLSAMPRIYAPVRNPTNEPYVTYYQVFVQVWHRGEPLLQATAPFLAGDGRGFRFGDMSDGTSSTFLVVEAGEPVPWTKPADIPYSATGPLPKLGGMFSPGFHGAFADGHVNYFPEGIADERTLRNLITMNDGEVVDLSGY